MHFLYLFQITFLFLLFDVQIHDLSAAGAEVCDLLIFSKNLEVNILLDCARTIGDTEKFFVMLQVCALATVFYSLEVPYLISVVGDSGFKVVLKELDDVILFNDKFFELSLAELKEVAADLNIN